MATAEGTARLLRKAVERGALHPRNVRHLPLVPRPASGADGSAAAAAAAAAASPASRLYVAAIGFGAYRVGGGDQERSHLAALRSAIRSGVNLVDTSSHYHAATGDPGGGHGASERLVGRAVAEACSEGDAERDGLVICTKVGHARVGGAAPPGAVPLGPPGQGGVQDIWHSIHPDFVDMEVRMCRERLGTAPDFVMLHNPEYFLSAQMQRRVPIAEAWDEMHDRLVEAFKALEALCDEGVIRSGYGVSSNFLSCMFSTTGRSNLYEALALDRVLDAAASAAGGKEGGHRFRLAQLPLNPVESGAVLGRGAAVPEAADGDCELASRLGLGLLTNRPLNALPLPGVSSGDWGRQGATHWQLRDKKPLGAVESLLKRVISGALQEGGADEAARPMSLQRAALKLSLSAPGVTSTLCGLRSEAYVEDAAALLREEPLSTEQVHRALTKVRAAAEELGCEKRGLW